MKNHRISFHEWVGKHFVSSEHFSVAQTIGIAQNEMDRRKLNEPIKQRL